MILTVRIISLLLFLSLSSILNCQELSNSKEINNIEELSDTSSNFSIYVSGEQHFSFGNDYIQFNLFQYLVKNNGVRILLTESGMGETYVLNQYLKTGDSALLNIANYYEIDRSFMKRLYLFRNELPVDQKFRMLGIDYEKNKDALLWSIKDIFLKSKITDSIHLFPYDCERVINELVFQGTPLFNSGIKKSLDQLLKQYDSNKKMFSHLMGDFFSDFSRMLENYRISKSLYGKNFEKKNCSYAAQREKMLYENVIAITKFYPGEKMYGQFGVLHVSITKQEKWWNKKSSWYSFVAMLNTEENSPFKSRVCSIQIIYPSVSEKDFRKRYYTYGFTFSELILKISQCGIHTCCLESVSSPDIKSNKFQYIIINRTAE